MTSQLDQRFLSIDAYTIADAARRRGTGGVIHSLTPQNDASRFVGRALTARVQLEPHKEVPLSQYAAGAFLDRVSEGDVVLLDGGGHFLSALGDLAATIIQDGRPATRSATMLINIDAQRNVQWDAEIDWRAMS